MMNTLDVSTHLVGGNRLFGGQQGELDAAEHGVDAVCADADAVPEMPSLTAARGGDDAVALAEVATLAGEILDSRHGDQALDEDFEQLDVESPLLRADHQGIELLAEALLHVLRGFPLHQLSLGGIGATLGVA